MSKYRLISMFSLIFVVVFVLSVIINKTYAAENLPKIAAFISSYDENPKVTYIQKVKLPKKPQPKTPKEIQDEANAKAKADAEKARLAAEKAKQDEANRVKAQFSAKAQGINSFLQKVGSPLKGYGEKLAMNEDKYGVSSKLVIAISGVESQYCKINFRPFNCWGWMGHSFDSYDTALDAYFAYIKNYYFSKGLNSPQLMQTIYAPDSTTWAANVQKYINTMTF